METEHKRTREISKHKQTHTRTSTQRDQSDESEESTASEQTCDVAQEEIGYVKEDVSVQVTHR